MDHFYGNKTKAVINWNHPLKGEDTPSHINTGHNLFKQNSVKVILSSKDIIFSDNFQGLFQKVQTCWVILSD